MATIRDIAKQAGVSDMTVSNVLAGRIKGVRADAAARAKRIRRIADEMGYRPHSAARSMKRGRFNAIGVLTRLETHVYMPMGLMHGVIARAEERRIAAHVAQLTTRLKSDEQLIPRILTELSVDGLLLGHNPEASSRVDAIIDRHAIPAVRFNVPGEHDCIYPADEEAAYTLTQWLIGQGRRRIAFLSHETMHYSVSARMSGYRQAMQDAGLTPRLEVLPLQRSTSVIERAASGAGAEALKRMRALLDGPDRPDAVVAYGPDRFVQPLEIVAAERGIDLGRDVLVGTFFRTPVFLADDRPIPTMRIHESNIGRVAVDMLLKRIESRDRLPARPYPLDLLLGNDVVVRPDQRKYPWFLPD